MTFLALFSIDAVRLWITTQGWWGGAFVSFALLFACGLGFPMPEDIPLIITGAFLCQGEYLPIWQEWMIVGGLNWAGIIGGDICLYWIARRYGMNITRVPIIGKHVTVTRIAKVQVWFDKYGVGVVAVGRLFAGVRGAMVITAGTIKFNFWKFLIADGLAAIISGGMFMVLGYFVGRSLNDKTISEFKHWFIASAIVLACGLLIYMIWRHRQHRTIVEAIVDEHTPKHHE
jgi:membrane protein DedA with SNARE-associated domain